MRIEYSPDERLLYLRLRPGEVAETIEVDTDVMADLNAAGEPVGIEFIDADAFFPFLARHAGTHEGIVVVDLPDGLAALARNRRALLTT